jgi:hypothetical protein
MQNQPKLAKAQIISQDQNLSSTVPSWYLSWPSLSLSLAAFCYYSSSAEFLWKKNILHHH